MPDRMLVRVLRNATPCLLGLGLATASADEFVAPYVPTVEEDVELMLDVARVGPGDYVIDLGSGDGRIIIAAARRGARGHGVELDPELVERARSNAREAGVADRVAFVQGDIFEADISGATIVTLYLFPEANLELRPKLLAELPAGTRVVSNSFHMGDWNADLHDMSARSSGGILLWRIPARIEGSWTLEVTDGARFDLGVRQQYQAIEVELGLPGAGLATGAALAIRSARLEGNRLRFGAEAADATYLFDGSVDGNRMQGYVQVERDGERGVARWRASRQSSTAQ